jgi:hypothetical protein
MELIYPSRMETAVSRVESPHLELRSVDDNVGCHLASTMVKCFERGL